MKKLFTTLLGLLFCAMAFSQTITVKDTVMATYPYGNPDPVPRIGKIYPYWRFQDFSQKAVEQSWKMVVLENEYLRVKIFPQIGGKVWSIFDKTAGRELVYDNDVVKFREIALRGPWTSGGIEFNFGVIGHAPSCSSPVDWKTETKPDGSVSCYIGVMEMTSRSRWTIEINLPADAAWCSTRATWHNQTAEWQPYYSWANSAVETSDDFVLLYPAVNAIFHDGEIETYPINEQGVDISVLANQTYGQDKSYHMIGSHKSFFGSYYPSDDWTSMHWSSRDEKLGRKYFTWAQSEQGNIWVDLLTDNRPQYVEMQSGRLFNQNDFSSSTGTPYRQILFTPYGTDGWADYWFPCQGIGIADNVTFDGVTSVREKGSKSILGIYPLRPYKGPVTVTDSDGKILYQSTLELKPTKTVNISIKGTPAKVTLGKRILWTSDTQDIDRPQSRIKDYDTESVENLVMLSRDALGMKLYDAAEAYADQALAASPHNIDALNLKAALLYHRMQYSEAYEYSGKALGIDEYNPEAGYIGGLAAEKLGKEYDAMDRLEVAAIPDSRMRSACYTELSAIHFRRGDLEMSESYARKALDCNAKNINALMILCRTGAQGTRAIEEIDPLNHFPAAESLLAGEMSATEFAGTFQEELPWQDCMELALFYHSLGLDNEAAALLEATPGKNVLTALWAAYLKKDCSAIDDALKCCMDFAFPSRAESAPMLEWAMKNSGSWKCRYLMALLKSSFRYSEEAAGLLKGDDSDYAPFYAFRYSLTWNTEDLRKAFALESEGWRYRRLLANDLINRGQYAEAVTLLKDYYAANPENFQVGDALMDAYIGLGQFTDAENIIDNITYLPFEGQRGSHDKWRHIKLHLAAIACDNGEFDKALSLVDEALEWPARLGAGKPYDDLIDRSKEDWTREQIIGRRDGSISGKLLPLMDDQRTKDKKLF